MKKPEDNHPVILQSQPRRLKLRLPTFDTLFLTVSVLIALFASFIVYDHFLHEGRLRQSLAYGELLVTTILTSCAFALLLYIASNRRTLTKTNQTLQTEIAKSRSLIDSLGDGIISPNKDGIIEFVNPQTINILNSSESILLGKKIAKAIVIEHGDGRPVPEEAQPHQIALTTGQVAMSDRYFYVRPDRVRIAVAITAAPIIRNGTVLGVVETFRDITTNREIEKSKDDFVVMASHELRTPLSAINWFSEMLLSGDAGELNEGQKDFMQEIHDSNIRLIEMVDMLLDISRVDLGKFIVEPEPTDIVMLASGAVKGVGVEMQRKNISIEQLYDQNIPKDIPLDKHLTWIVINNFLTNAIKYTHDGDTIELRVSFNNQDELPIAYWAGKDKSILISVTDHGMGIPKAQQEKIFSKLFRAENAATSLVAGNGLGLYLVKQIVEQNGGKIWFESEENKGTTFFVNLPASGMQAKAGTKRLGSHASVPSSPSQSSTQITEINEKNTNA